jgi:recombination protein RecA
MTNLDAVLTSLNKKFGAGIVQPYSEFEYPDVETISTGSLALDLAIGGRKKFLGAPVGAITILWGPKAAGKSTLCSHIIANAQGMGKKAALLDMEFSFDRNYARACGVDLDSLLFVRCVTDEGVILAAEDAWEVVEKLTRSGEVGLIVIDSLNAMVPRAEVDGEWGEAHWGKSPKLNAQAARKLAGPLKSQGVALVITAQRRYKMGVVFGSPETMSGGEAFKHSAALKIDLRPTGSADKNVEKNEAGDIIGGISRCKIPWNKIAPPRGKADIFIRWGEGVVREGEIVDLGVETGVIIRKGSYYYFPPDEESFIQGRDNVIDYLTANPDLAASLESQIRSAFGTEEMGSSSEEGAAEEPQDGGDS